MIADNRVTRLGTFLRSAGPLLMKDIPVPKAPPKPERLGEVVASLRPHIDRKRSTGGFLNVWVAAGLRQDEVRNAGVLAALLDPVRLGDLSRALLGTLVDDLKQAHPSFAVIDVTGPYTVSTEVCPLGGRDTRIDLVVEGKGFLLGIEVKIGAQERKGQLSDYLTILSHKAELLNKSAAMIYLSPKPSPVMPAGIGHVTWQDIGTAARKVARTYRKQYVAASLLEQFGNHVATFK